MGYGALREASIKKKGGCKCCWSTIEMEAGSTQATPPMSRWSWNKKGGSNADNAAPYEERRNRAAMLCRMQKYEGESKNATLMLRCVS